MKRKRILVDFDGVIKKRGSLSVVDGALNVLQQMKNAGYELIVFSTRETCEARSKPDFIKNFMDSRGIPYDQITGEKLDADFYIDDKAIEFKDWQTTKDRLWKKKE